jgi:hypothetical protein
MILFRNLAKRDWEKYDPEKVAALKKAGIYEKELDRVALQASEELARLVSAGNQYEAARSLVIQTLLLTPEDDGTFE